MTASQPSQAQMSVHAVLFIVGVTATGVALGLAIGGAPGLEALACFAVGAALYTASTAYRAIIFRRLQNRDHP